MQNMRRKIWIDGFQTRLAWRVALYFAIYQLAVWFLVSIERNIYLVMEQLFDSTTAGYIFVYLVAAVVLVGVLFIYEAIKFTHRLVGPIYRFRKVVQAIRDGEEIPLIQLRQGDFLQELKDEFNEMLKVLGQRGAVTLKAQPAVQVQPDAVVPAAPESLTA